MRVDGLQGCTLAGILEGLEAAAWTVSEPAFDPAKQHHMETVFTTGNGHFSLRGDFEEGYPGSRPACFMHGLWDDMPINFTELANIPRWWGLELWVNGVPFRLDLGAVLGYSRRLDLRTGVPRAHRLLAAGDGAKSGDPLIELRFERFAVLAPLDGAEPGARQRRRRRRPQPRPAWPSCGCRCALVGGPAEVRLRTGLDLHVENFGLLHWDLAGQDVNPGEAILHARTRATQHDLVLAATLTSSGADMAAGSADCSGHPAMERTTTLAAGQTLTVEKFVALVRAPQPGRESRANGGRRPARDRSDGSGERPENRLRRIAAVEQG